MFCSLRTTDMNVADLAEELGLEEEEVRGLIMTFLESTEKDLLLLGRAFSEGNTEELGSVAHNIKGAASNLELNQIAETARAIENKARSGILEDPASQIQRIRDRLEPIRTQVSPRE
jgi:HPt (histidine-containing phosphotransfer) domain-containing protein